MDFLSVWKTFTQPNKIVKQSVHLRLSLLSVQRGKNLKTLIKIEMLRSVEKKVVVRVSAQVSNRDKISVWPDFGQAGATLPARSEELSLPIVLRESGTEGADSRLLVLPYSHRPQGAQKAALLLDHLNLGLVAFVVKKNNQESERRHSSVLGSNRLILS